MTERPNLNDFIEAWPIFADAVWAGSLAGIALGVLGVYIVLGRMVFLTAALSQVASLGVATTYLLAAFLGGVFTHFSPTFGSLIFVLFCLILALKFDEEDRSERDAMLGILFVGGSSGTLLIANLIPQEMADIQSILFGSAVAVLPADLYLVGICVLLALTLQLLGWRGFVEMLYDPSTARVRRLPLPTLRWLLVGSIAVLVAIITRTLGALPTFSMTILPAIAAIQWAPNIPRAMLLAGFFGLTMGSVGYFVAFRYGFPVGASQTIVGIVLVFFSKVIKAIQQQATRSQMVEPSIIAPAQPHHHHHHGHSHRHHQAHAENPTNSEDDETTSDLTGRQG